MRNSAGQRVEVLPDRGSTRAHQEFRRRESFELSADEVEAFRITNNPCFLRAEPQPPSCEELSQLGEDDRFELPSRTGQHHESSSPGELHRQALTEPDVNLSTHPAPIVQSQGEFRCATVRTSLVLGGQRGRASEPLVDVASESFEFTTHPVRQSAF